MSTTHDQESRLTSVLGGSTNEPYTYDGDGARIKVVSGNTGDYYEYKVSRGCVKRRV